jgi:hypothetical protein
LNEKHIQEESTTNKPHKRHVGRSKKTFEATLLSPNEIKKEGDEARDGKCQKKGPSLVEDEKKSKERGAYTNWFQPHLWPPIAITIKKHGNNSNAIHFLKTTYKKPNMPSPYERLNRACLWD